jgi:hypothetical protein
MPPRLRADGASSARQPTDRIQVKEQGSVDGGDRRGARAGAERSYQKSPFKPGLYVGNPSQGYPVKLRLTTNGEPCSGAPYSGPVTLGPEETQEKGLTLKTTYMIKGRFKAGKKHGSYTATGTDSSPICQASTLKKFTAKFDK